MADAATWKKHVAAWRASGETAAAYCDLHPDLGVARERSMRERLRDIRLSGDTEANALKVDQGMIDELRVHLRPEVAVAWLADAINRLPPADTFGHHVFA